MWPFIFSDLSDIYEFDQCEETDEPEPWCSLKTDDNGWHVTGNWGFCGLCEIPPGKY